MNYFVTFKKTEILNFLFLIFSDKTSKISPSPAPLQQLKGIHLVSLAKCPDLLEWVSSWNSGFWTRRLSLFLFSLALQWKGICFRTIWITMKICLSHCQKSLGLVITLTPLLTHPPPPRMHNGIAKEFIKTLCLWRT